MRYLVKLTALRDLEKKTKLVMTIAHIYKISNEEALKRVDNLPLVLMRQAREAQADKMLKIFRTLGADIIIEEEAEPADATQAPRTSPNMHPSPKSKGAQQASQASKSGKKPPGRASRDAKMSLSTIGIIAILTLVGLGAGAFFFWNQTQPQSTKAQRLIREGRFEEAHEHLKKTIHAGTGTAGDYIQQAMVLIMMARQEQDSTGWDDFGTYGIDESPKWGEDLLKTPKANRALRLIRMGVERYPENPELNRWEGFILQTKGLYDEAESAYNEAVNKDPQNPLYRNLLGTLNKDQGLYDKADFQFRKILSIDSNDTQAINNLTVLNLSHRRDTLMAMRYFRKNSNAKDPARYALRKEMSQAAFLKFNHKAYPKDGKPQIPFRYYEAKRKELQARVANSPSARVELGDLYAQRGMLDAARTEFNLARKKGVRTPDLYAQLAQIYIAQENPASALYILKEAVKEDQTNPEVLKNLTLLSRYYSEDVNTANKYLRQYLEAGGDRHQQELYEAVVDP